MARTEVVTCDVCGAKKEETNHWFVCYPVIMVGELASPDPAGRMFDLAGRMFDLCGEAHALQKMSELIHGDGRHWILARAWHPTWDELDKW